MNRSELEAQLAYLREQLERVQAEPEARGAGAGGEKAARVQALQQQIAQVETALEGIGKRGREEDVEDVEVEEEDEAMDELSKARKALDYMKSIRAAQPSKNGPALRFTIAKLQGEVEALERRAQQEQRAIRNTEMGPMVAQILAANRPLETARLSTASREFRDIVYSSQSRLTQDELDRLLTRLSSNPSIISDERLTQLMQRYPIDPATRRPAYDFSRNHNAAVHVCSGSAGFDDGIEGIDEGIPNFSTRRPYFPQCLRFLLTQPQIDPSRVFIAAVAYRDFELFQKVLKHPNFDYEGRVLPLVIFMEANRGNRAASSMIRVLFYAGLEFVEAIVSQPFFDVSRAFFAPVYDVFDSFMNLAFQSLERRNDDEFRAAAVRIARILYSKPNLPNPNRHALFYAKNSAFAEIAVTTMMVASESITTDMLAEAASIYNVDFFHALVQLTQRDDFSEEDTIMQEWISHTKAFRVAAQNNALGLPESSSVEIFKHLMELRLFGKPQQLLEAFQTRTYARRSRFRQALMLESDPILDLLFAAWKETQGEFYRDYPEAEQWPEGVGTSILIDVISNGDVYAYQRLKSLFPGAFMIYLRGVFESFRGEFRGPSRLAQNILPILLEEPAFRAALQSDEGQSWMASESNAYDIYENNQIQELSPYMTNNTFMMVFKEVLKMETDGDEELMRRKEERLRFMMNNDKFDPKLFGGF